VVAAVFVVIVGAALLYALSMEDTYEARTKLLIVAPVSGRLIEDLQDGEERLQINPFLGTNLSVETLSALGKANDLLQNIITRLNFRDEATGRPWSVERLAKMIEVSVETVGMGDTTTSLPLLTMTVQGKEPETLKRIAETWSQTFRVQNSQLFATEAARSYDFVVSQYNETSSALQSKEEELLAYQQANPLSALESQLRVLSAKYEDFLTRLHQKRSELVEAQVRLESAEEALANESQFVTLEQTISSEALLILLANSPENIDMERIPDLVSRNQELNELYLSLKTQVVTSRSNVATLTSDIAYLEDETQRLKGQIVDTSSQISSVRLNLARLEREIGC
jgi:uncharacterized protein involved in exopolysaccharide biosynthesis